jgi:hypothetical protein
MRYFFEDQKMDSHEPALPLNTDLPKTDPVPVAELQSTTAQSKAAVEIILEAISRARAAVDRGQLAVNGCDGHISTDTTP